MFVRSDSDNPIDRIAGGLMMAIGGEPVDEILELIGQQQQVVERELAAVPARAQGRGSDFVAKAKPQLDALVGALKDYGTWLASAKESLEVGDTSRCVEAYEDSHNVLPALNAAAEQYSHVFANFGPYQSLPANGMDRLADGIISGEVQVPAWKEMLDYYSNGIQQMLERAQQSNVPGRGVLVENFRAALKELQGLSSVDPKAKASYSGSLQSLDHYFHQAERLENLMGQADSGPTKIPATNILLSLLSGYRAGEFDKDMLDTVVDEYGEFMDNFSETFEESVSKPIDSVLVQEEIPRTLSTLDAHYAAVEELISALEGDEQDELDQVTQNLIATAQKIEESRNVYATASQHETQILCPSCSRSNPPENRLCEACGEKLPRSADASSLASSTFSVMASQQVLEENQQLVMTENVARLFDACDAVADGNITHEEFLDEVRRAQAGLKEFAQELDELAESLMDRSSFSDEQWAVWETQHLPHLEDVASGFLHGLAEGQSGLEKMAYFVQDPNEQHLVNGVRQVWEGLGVIHRASLSFQTYSKMLDDVMSEAAADGLISSEG